MPACPCIGTARDLYDFNRRQRRQACSLAPAGWQCIRDPGHDGPCAAAPLIETKTMHACPDIEQCIECGCQCQCGPKDHPPKRTWKERLQALIDWML